MSTYYVISLTAGFNPDRLYDGIRALAVPAILTAAIGLTLALAAISGPEPGLVIV